MESSKISDPFFFLLLLMLRNSIHFHYAENASLRWQQGAGANTGEVGFFGIRSLLNRKGINSLRKEPTLVFFSEQYGSFRTVSQTKV